LLLPQSRGAITRIVLSLHELPDGLFDDAYITLRYAAILYDSDLSLMRSQSDKDAVWFQQAYSVVREYQLG
jgi:hypothetical protein